jgi:hypothetical protein
VDTNGKKRAKVLEKMKAKEVSLENGHEQNCSGEMNN